MKTRMPRTAKKPDSGEEPGLKVEGEHAASPLEEAASSQTRQPFPIIGIGASAGGLETNGSSETRLIHVA